MRRRERDQVMAARITAIVVGILATLLGILAEGVNVAVLVILAICIAASANFPVLVLSLFWHRFNYGNVIGGMASGLVSSVGLGASSTGCTQPPRKAVAKPWRTSRTQLLCFHCDAATEPKPFTAVLPDFSNKGKVIAVPLCARCQALPRMVRGTDPSGCSAECTTRRPASRFTRGGYRGRTQGGAFESSAEQPA